MAETFRKTWRGEVVSSNGFSVRLSGKNALTYKDGYGELRVFTEPMSGSRTIEVFSDGIPESPERSRLQVMDNIARALRHAGWVSIPA